MHSHAVPHGPWLKSDVPTVIGLGVGMSVFMALTCLVLRLFSRARFAQDQARGYGNAHLAPPGTNSTHHTTNAHSGMSQLLIHNVVSSLSLSLYFFFFHSLPCYLCASLENDPFFVLSKGTMDRLSLSLSFSWHSLLWCLCFFFLFFFLYVFWWGDVIFGRRRETRSSSQLPPPNIHHRVGNGRRCGYVIVMYPPARAFAGHPSSTAALIGCRQLGGFLCFFLFVFLPPPFITLSSSAGGGWWSYIYINLYLQTQQQREHEERTRSATGDTISTHELRALSTVWANNLLSFNIRLTGPIWGKHSSSM